MIEAIETHETQITKTVPVKLTKPLRTGIWFGIGLIIAPTVLFIIISIISFFIMWFWQYL